MFRWPSDQMASRELRKQVDCREMASLASDSALFPSLPFLFLTLTWLLCLLPPFSLPLPPALLSPPPSYSSLPPPSMVYLNTVIPRPFKGAQSLCLISTNRLMDEEQKSKQSRLNWEGVFVWREGTCPRNVVYYTTVGQGGSSHLPLPPIGSELCVE